MGMEERCRKILEYLISNPSTTSASIEKKFKLTKRQLGYTMGKINEWLKTNNLPMIERTRQGHFVIDKAIFTEVAASEELSFVSESQILTEEHRIYVILLMLLSSMEELSLYHFTFELDVSKNTVLSDLKKAQKLLDEYNLSINYSRKHGYVLKGNEFKIRKLLLDVTYQMLEMMNGEDRIKKIAMISDEKMTEFTNRILEVENKLNLRFTDEKLKTMSFVLFLILKRIEKGHQIDDVSLVYKELSHTKEYQATEALLRDYKNITVSERLFITLHLLTADVVTADFSSEALTSEFLPAIDRMLRQFEKSACIYFEDREELIERLLQHLKPAYYRIRYHLTDTMNFQGKMSRQFQALHHLVKRSISPLKEFIGSEIPENEIIPITMHVGAWMSRQKESIEKKIKAVVVCPQGVSVSKVMFNELRDLFPEFVFLDYLSVREFIHYSLDYDVVFSPIFIETNKKLFVTKVLLGKEDKSRLRKQVVLEIHGYLPHEIDFSKLVDVISNHAIIQNKDSLVRDLKAYFNRDENMAIVKEQGGEWNLNEFITPDRIQIKNAVHSWEDAVKICAAPLVESGNITEGYIDSMIQYSVQDSYIMIGPGVAIPHASPEEGVKEVGMSLLVVKEGVDYLQNNRIYLIIVIAAEDKKKHIHALMQLIKMVSCEEDRNKLLQSESTNEVFKIVSKYSHR